jgi:hypothetical protein
VDNAPVSSFLSRGKTYENGWCMQLEFGLRVHFAIWPILMDSMSFNRTEIDQRMLLFRKFLDTSGSQLAKQPSLTSYYALPFVAPEHLPSHPGFSHLFDTMCTPQQRSHLQDFLQSVPASADVPRLYTLLHTHAGPCSGPATSPVLVAVDVDSLLQGRCGLDDLVTGAAPATDQGSSLKTQPWDLNAAVAAQQQLFAIPEAPNDIEALSGSSGSPPTDVRFVNSTRPETPPVDAALLKPASPEVTLSASPAVPSALPASASSQLTPLATAVISARTSAVNYQSMSRDGSRSVNSKPCTSTGSRRSSHADSPPVVTPEQLGKVADDAGSRVSSGGSSGSSGRVAANWGSPRGPSVGTEGLSELSQTKRGSPEQVSGDS